VLASLFVINPVLRMLTSCSSACDILLSMPVVIDNANAYSCFQMKLSSVAYLRQLLADCVGDHSESRSLSTVVHQHDTLCPVPCSLSPSALAATMNQTAAVLIMPPAAATAQVALTQASVRGGPYTLKPHQYNT
jgi:hypothetical protein